MEVEEEGEEVEVEVEEEGVLPSLAFLEVVVGEAGGQMGQWRHWGGMPHLVLMGVGVGGEGAVTVGHYQGMLMPS